MKKRKTLLGLLLAMVIGISMLPGTMAHAAGGVTLYTPYTNISVTPGQTVNYSIDVINDSSSVQDVTLGVEGLGKDWQTQLTSGGWTLHQIAVKPNDSESVSLELDVPLQVDKGEYSFYVTADGNRALPLKVNVTEQGTFATELTTDQPNMEGKSDATFSFEVSLKNKTADDQTYALSTSADRGWDVTFLVGGNSVTSTKVKAGEAQSVSVSIKPPANIKAGEYKIPIQAATSTTSAKLTLDVVVTGSYKLSLTGPNGILSTNVTAGNEKSLALTLKNEGSADLKDISMSSSLPTDWNVTFKPDKIDDLAAGQSTTVTAIIKPSGKAIAGDYVATLSANTPEANASSDFRVTVKTSMLWGWIGILIIAAVIGLVYYLFRTYGRR